MKENFSLLPFNTFGIDVKAKYFAEFEDKYELIDLLNSSEMKREKLLVLGGGSNVLLTKDFDGVVLKNSIPDIKLIEEDDKYVFLKVGAGVNWHDFVLHCIENNYAGVENLSLIPGSVGAAPMQNIGAYGVELKDVFHSLTALRIEDCKSKKFDIYDCKFGYRESVFKRALKDQFIILDVTFKLTKLPTFNIQYGTIKEEIERLKPDPDEDLTIQLISQAVINIRQSKLPDPKEIGNAGSFFKNPVIPYTQAKILKERFPELVVYPVDERNSKVAAGWLIDNLGWKGKRIDNYGVHVNQALVLINYGGASGADIFELSGQIIEAVYEEYGIMLQREVNIY